ncbi:MULTISPECIES: CBS domain-containing protein [Shewanella]|jgi:predicted transcriptional regulator|uniref:CBS domain-containing protein n=1 Tax=Shewanella holmiensis TaxID=2952222 RepID=A0A9X3AUF2_9GAMM|nr:MULTISPECIES: CBS domain-containing protein [Shewanella]MCT7941480.1 CBS domain-containing protein [Shewanella holmiensis]MDP5145416.1 CBS domain-containing protein [Shewanella sp. ULN5]
MNAKTPVRNRDVLNQDYAMVEGTITVSEAIAVALAKNVKVLVVNKRSEHDEYGLVLMSDIARKVLAKDKSPDRTNVYEIMIKPVFSVSADMDVRYTARLFERFDINKAPVLEDNDIKGFVTYDDIVLKGMINT